MDLQSENSAMAAKRRLDSEEPQDESSTGTKRTRLELSLTGKNYDHPSIEETSDDENVLYNQYASKYPGPDNGTRLYGPENGGVQSDGSDFESRHLELHQVICSATAPGHESHLGGLYHDVPRLYTGDTKASLLRGRVKVGGLGEHLAEILPPLFVVTKKYGCEAYHKENSKHFVSPNFDLSFRKNHVQRDLILSLSFLKNDLPSASPYSETISNLHEDLSKAINVVTQMHPLHFNSWSSSQLHYPYPDLFHARPLLETILDDLDNPRYHDPISELLSYMQASTRLVYDEIDALFESSQVNGYHLDKLFAPGELVVCFQDDQPVALKVKERLIKQGKVELICSAWQFDGRFRNVEVERVIQWVHGLEDDRPISSLDTYPLRFGGPELIARLHERGLVFWSCRHRNFVSYHAPFQPLDIPTAPPRFMIDHDMYHQMEDPYDSTEMPSTGDGLSEHAFNATTPPEYPFVLMLPPTIIGLQMENKKWKKLLVEHIRPVQWNTEAFNHLVLDSDKKEFIKALVMRHLSDSRRSQTADFIDDKGKGLIMLFHGGPGTGKTLTAESIADLAKKPLYRVTCGDIGTEAESVEKYLNTVLHIGALWGCVVLLDEADVFLEARTQTDLQRNALVSVFLRVLEYYQGILILTTNRIGTFDEAFKSRIQLPLHYPNLNLLARKQIWHNFISRLSSDLSDEERSALHGKVDILAVVNLNGRQIRNTIRNAEQLAQYRKEKLDYSHFEKALKVANEFEEYLQMTHGHTDDEFARQGQIRH